jgi:hypothetical protein
MSATTSAPNCAGDGNPQLELLNEVGELVFREDDVTETDLCAAASTTLDVGTYRVCVAESVDGTREVLFDVVLAIEVLRPTSVLLPYATTLTTIDVPPQCFAFTLDEPANVHVDAAGDDPRCLLPYTNTNAVDTIVTLDELEVDDNGPDLCATLTTVSPLSIGDHVACVRSYSQPASNVSLEIWVSP